MGQAVRSVLRELARHRDGVRDLLRVFEPREVSGSAAADIVSAAEDLERAASALKLMAAGRVEETGLHERRGHRSAGSWLAEVTGEPVGRALSGLETLRAAKRHPSVEEALRAGALSVERAKQITAAAEVFPEHAPELVEAASEQGFEAFKKTCEAVRFASRSVEDEVTRHERIRRSRSCRIWTDQEGFGRLEAKLTTDAMAVVKGSLESFERDIFNEARTQGVRESRQAYMADALVAMAQGSSEAGSGSELSENSKVSSKGASRCSGSNRPRCLVRIRVDLEALRRGYAEPGETCEIPGVGRVAVPIARDVLGESLLQMVITNGVEVSTVVSDTRHIKKALMVALQERDPVCVAPGCTASDHLEVDHWRTDFANGGRTELDNLCRLCGWHHDQKTYGGWVVGGGPGRWSFEEQFVCSTGPPLDSGDVDRAHGANAPPEPEKLF